MDGVVEIVTGRERRRRWSAEAKLRIVAELDEPGARVCDVAARHGVCESLVFTWRRQVREGALVMPGLPVFSMHPAKTTAAVGQAATAAFGVGACQFQGSSSWSLAAG